MAVFCHTSTLESDKFVPTFAKNHNSSRSSLKVFPASVSVIEIVVFRTFGVDVEIHISIVGILVRARRKQGCTEQKITKPFHQSKNAY